MKYLNVFDDKSALDSSVTSFKHGDGAFVFGVDTSQGVEDVTIYDQRHPGPNCPEVYKAYPVNMSPVKLDASSEKKKPEVGDILYATTDRKLTLDTPTISTGFQEAIGICVIPEITENFKNGDSTGTVKTARFVSLNYMSYKTPTTGSKDAQNMYFGNQGVTIGNVKGGTDKTSYIGGKWNTQKCLHACTREKNDLTNDVTNNLSAGYCAPACCCVAYRTTGTKPGDWYLPMPGELSQIYANRKTINEKRTTLVGKGYNGLVWSSREVSSDNEYYVNLSNISIAKKLKNNSCSVLAFLALEV